MSKSHDLGPLILIVSVVAGLAANHAGWNPWLWGLVAFAGTIALLTALMVWAGD